MAVSKVERTQYIPIDQRQPFQVRALILARTSDPGGGNSDVESQVDQCARFISTMGWTLLHPDDLYAYAEHATGMRQVRRPVLRQVLQMAARHEVDVIVCLALARIDRKKARRYHAIQTALDFGVEFRFANRADTRGALPDGTLGVLQELSDDLYDEQEARKIVERLSPGKMKRYEQGLPHGGRAGPLYGYAEGERLDRRKGVLTWVIDEPKAAWIRWLFTRVDETDISELSLRGLARDLETRGAPTATGTGHWSAKQVYNLLRNGKYAGQGRNLRYQVTWGKYTDASNGEVFDAPQVRERDLQGTYPVSAEAIPPIIDDAHLWERVQAKLDALRAEHQRGGPRRTDAEAQPGLFDGFAFCAHCGGKLTRYWQSRDTRLYYACAKRSGTPFHACAPHHARAQPLDALALHLLADALTDPQKIAHLADAAQDVYLGYVTDAELAASALQAHQTHLAMIDTQRANVNAALHALANVPGMEQQITELRVKLDDLDRLRAEADEQMLRAEPAQRRAQARAVLLDKLRHGGLLLHYDDPETGERRAVESVTRDMLARITGQPSPGDLLNQQRIAQGLEPLNAIDAIQQANQALRDKGEWRVPIGEVAEALLLSMPRVEFRRLLRDLQVTVLLARPRSRAEWALHGPTPLTERLSLQLAETVVIRSDVSNVNRFSYPVRAPSAESACGT